MPATPDQLRAALILLRLEQSDLARHAQTSINTIRRLEATDGHRCVSPATIDTVQTALEQAGAEFIPTASAAANSPTPSSTTSAPSATAAPPASKASPPSSTPTSTTSTAFQTDSAQSPLIIV